ncbi:MAG: hypothetical protein JKY18_04295, partial [Flavobacteriales bacterium]|nr:hypothetical protein [Flavobacteriales bacterium]
MKNSFLIIGCFALVLFSGTVRAQSCTGCTITISGVETAPQVIFGGQTLCITSTGVLQGDLVVNQGSVCNEGTINSTAITMTNGTFTNYGTINSNGMIMAGGDFTNDGPANID